MEEQEHDINSRNAPQMLQMKDFNRKRKQKQLIFDRRYGWVYDEWRDPAQVALVGGRGMFCIVPLTKAAAGLTFQWVNIVADFVIQVLESPSHPHLPQVWLKTAKESVGHEFRNWCRRLKSFRRKSCLSETSHVKLFNLWTVRSKPLEQSGLQYTGLQEDKNKET